MYGDLFLFWNQVMRDVQNILCGWRTVEGEHSSIEPTTSQTKKNLFNGSND